MLTLPELVHLHCENLGIPTLVVLVKATLELTNIFMDFMLMDIWNKCISMSVQEAG